MEYLQALNVLALSDPHTLSSTYVAMVHSYVFANDVAPRLNDAPQTWCTMDTSISFVQSSAGPEATTTRYQCFFRAEFSLTLGADCRTSRIGCIDTLRMTILTSRLGSWPR